MIPAAIIIKYYIIIILFYDLQLTNDRPKVYFRTVLIIMPVYAIYGKTKSRTFVLLSLSKVLFVIFSHISIDIEYIELSHIEVF